MAREMNCGGVPVLLIRHGAVKGNKEHRYVGSTDEHLLPESQAELSALREKWERCADTDQAELSALPEARTRSAGDGIRVYTSPLFRARETAEILFPGIHSQALPGFRECEFGKFEYRNYRELNGDPDYQNYIDSGGTSGFPGGETLAEFQKRTVNTFLSLPEICCQDGNARAVVIVAHGGTVMALLGAFSEPHGDYFSWQVPNAGGYSCRWDPARKKLMKVRRLPVVS